MFQERVSDDQVSWNGKEKKGSGVPQGLYIYSVRINSRTITGKIMKQ
jgi:flagellar hook assembly protein FlgD